MSTKYSELRAPDVSLRDKQIAAINAKIQSIDAELTKVQAQWKGLTSSPSGSNHKQLISQLNELKSKQAGFKVEKNTLNSKIKELDASLKSKIAAIQAATNSKFGSFKTVEEIDSKIARNEDSISNGSLSLVEERAIIKENTNLRKLRKDVANVAVSQAAIDADKVKIAELKAKLSEINSQSRAASAQYDKLQAELDSVTKTNNESRSQRDAIFEKRKELYKEKDAQYDKLNKVRTEFNAAFKNFKAKEALSRKAADQEEKRAALKLELQEAQKPAFAREIEVTHSLIAHFDPTYVKPTTNNAQSILPVATEGINAVKKGRVIEAFDEDLIIKKTDEVFISAKSKKKSAPKKKKFFVESHIIAQLADLGVAVPTSEEEYPATIEALKSKLTSYQENEEKEGKKRVQKIQKKIDALEKELAAEDEKEEEKEEKTEEDAEEKSDE